MDWWTQEKLIISNLGFSSPRKGVPQRFRLFGAGLFLVVWGVLASWQLRSSLLTHWSNRLGAAATHARVHNVHNLLRSEFTHISDIV